MEAIHIETTVGKGGTLVIPELKEGEKVEVTVLRKPKRAKAKAKKPVRELGWAKGWVHILPGFDDPIPGMEEYM